MTLFDDPAAQAAYDAAFAESAHAERTRIAAIMDSAEAKARPVLARRLALTTDMSAEDAEAFMADLPAEARAGITTEPDEIAVARAWNAARYGDAVN